MVDILKMGASSLVNIQQALNTTSHNIANVNTEGYSRQTVEFAARDSQQFGFGFLGKGSTIAGVERAYNSFVNEQVLEFSSTNSQYESFLSLSARLDDIVANSDSSLSSSVQTFFNSLQEVASNPTGLPERQVLLSNAQSLVDKQRRVDTLLTDLNSEINSELRSTVTEINGLADSISLLNKEIVSAMSSGAGDQPNDLLDHRDRLLKTLSEKISITTVAQGDGALNVFVGNGQPLVISNETTHLQVQPNVTDSSKLEIGIAGQTSTSPITQFLKGGQIEGLVDFRERVLAPAQAQLGLVALALSESINEQHGLGMNLNGAMGGDFFQVASITVSSHPINTGSANPTVSLDNVGEVRASEYSVEFDGSQWQITRLSDNTSVSGAGPLNIDGMIVDVSVGTPAAGDRFFFNPSKEASANFGLQITNPESIAVSSPVRLATPTTNIGSGQSSGLTVLDGTLMPISASISLEFDPDALGPGLPGMLINGGVDGTVAYDPTTDSDGLSVNLPAFGISVQLEGVPEAGDTFNIVDNSGGFGDNSNVLKMAELQFSPVMNGSSDTYQEFYGSMVAQIGVTTRQAESNLAVEGLMLEQATSYQDSVRGVNLDEEASNMLRLQQAYQASAQMIKIADELFNTLINSIR